MAKKSVNGSSEPKNGSTSADGAKNGAKNGQGRPLTGADVKTQKKALAAMQKRQGGSSQSMALPALGILAAIVGAFVAARFETNSAPSAVPPPPDEEEDLTGIVNTWANETECTRWAASGECKNNAAFMRDSCALACKKAPKPPEADASGLVNAWHTESECLAWAGAGECEKNKQFMETSCALSCHRIMETRRKYEQRCSRPAGAAPAVGPGQMNATFARIMEEFGDLEPEMINVDPPIVLFHRFIDDAEADALIAHGKGKYTESRGVGVDKDGKMTDVKTEIRTSSHTWCQDSTCLADKQVQAIVSRVQDVTQVPSTNGEYAQLVYYRACPEEGHPSCAFYKRHSDYIEGDQYRVQGPRVYTLFMYLNNVEEGGGTRFTDLPNGPITFQPQRGKAILWPSVMHDNVEAIDDRTHHEALPVTKGEKFGANFWIHQYDFKGPHQTGCTLS